ncbi:hypothetical protein RJT34_13349 [Clitoria ternatea]|uniref:Kinetochore protein NDC80 n=1 Tax=Clitoria ternatea TaxID=43366 RepID=A0AAN9JQG9_CLITE
MRPTARRQTKDPFNPPPPPTPVDFHHRQYPSRDSDASFASSRPSSVGVGVRTTNLDFYKERSFQQAAVATINSFLSSQNFPITFRTTVPTGKDITETLKFLASIVNFPISKLEDDLPLLLKRLSCPFKLNKSMFKSAAPHQWPLFVALIHWLVQICKFHLHLSTSPKHHHAFYQNTIESYINYIEGNDDVVDELDNNFRDKIHHEKLISEEKLNAAKQNVANLEAELEGLRSAPSRKEELEKEKGELEGDVKKFHKIIEELTSRIEQAERVLAEKEKRLEAKVAEKEKICEENEDLKRREQMQTFNARDVERMRRELQAVERGTAEAELARNTWEEKSWEIDTNLSHKIKDLEVLALDCNQALRRLKIANEIQYQLNPKGTTPAEIMGIDHKLMLKPALNSYVNEIKKGSMAKLEESISYQQKSSENAVRLEAKRNQLTAVQSRIEVMEAKMNMLRKETQEYTNRCSAEAKKMLEDVQVADHNLDITEREAADVLKTSELKLREAIRQSEEEIQLRAHELFQLIDSVSKYKEYAGSKISEMRRDLSETAAAVSDAYKGPIP